MSSGPRRLTTCVWIYLNQETEDELRWWAARANLTAGRPLSRSDDDNCNERLHGGLGGSPGQLGGLWRVVDCLGQVPYQLARAPGGMADHATLAPVAWCCCGCLVRQCHNGRIHQQRGRDAVTLLVPTGTSGMVQGTPGSRPLFREKEHPGGHSVNWKHRHPTEWSMHKVTVALMFEHWPTPHVDLFAFEKYRKLPVFFSARPSRTSSESNALTQNWEHLYGYTFPPFSLIRRILTGCSRHPGSYWLRGFGPVICGSVS